MEINGQPVEFDFSKTDLGDWELVMRCAKTISADDVPKWIDLLDRVLIGGKKVLPMNAFHEVNRAFYDQLAELSNPKVPKA